MSYSNSTSLNNPRLLPDLENFSFAALAKSVFDAPKKQTILRLRWLIITVASYLLLFAQETLLPANLIRAFVLVYIASNASLHPLEAKSFDSLPFLAALVFADSIALSFALILAGQLGSDFYLSYFLIIIMAGFWKDFRWSMAFAIVLSLFYSVLLFLAESVTTHLLLRAIRFGGVDFLQLFRPGGQQRTCAQGKSREGSAPRFSNRPLLSKKD